MAMNNNKMEKLDYPELEFHIQTILKSGIILDDDLDAILAHYNMNTFEKNEKVLTTSQKQIGFLSFAAALLFKKMNYPMFSVLIISSPALVYGLRAFQNMLDKKNHQCNIEEVTSNLQKLAKCNKQILEYFERKAKENDASQPGIDLFSVRLKELIETVLFEELKLFRLLRDHIIYFCSIVPSYLHIYSYVYNMNLNEFTPRDVRNLKDCAVYMNKICDIFVLFASNCLTCVALTLCPDQLMNNNVDLDRILDQIIPKIRLNSRLCYDKVLKKFEEVQYYYVDKVYFKPPPEKPKPDVSTKLQISTFKAMAHTTEIVEKSQIVFNKIQSVDMENLKEKEKLAKYIFELRSHVFEYCESLDVLHKLFEININATKRRAQMETIEIDEEKPDESQSADVDIVNDASQNPTEPTDDEEYELNIGPNDPPVEIVEQNFSREEEEAMQYFRGLQKELKQKLSAHNDFIRARKKRGVEDVNVEILEQKPEPPPLPELSLQCQLPGTVAPPPPPPPMPEIVFFSPAVVEVNHIHQSNTYQSPELLNLISSSVHNQNVEVYEIFSDEGEEE